MYDFITLYQLQDHTTKPDWPKHVTKMLKTRDTVHATPFLWSNFLCSFPSPRNTWEDNIKLDIQKIIRRLGGMVVIHEQLDDWFWYKRR